jgi:hypothetical protein
MAMKQAPNIGKSIVTFAVISTTRTMPVSGARTTPMKKGGHPDNGESFRSNVQIWKYKLAELTEETS